MTPLRRFGPPAAAWCAAALLLAGLPAAAQGTEPGSTEPGSTVSGAPPGSPDRFGPHEDSFVVWNRMRNNGWAGNDEGATRAHYSFKYTFCGPRLGREGESVRPASAKDEPTLCPGRDNWWSQVEFFAAYTGEFDFYFGSRASSPVINRLSQPGLFARVPMRAFGVDADAVDSVELGLQHRSNGQVGDVEDPAYNERAARAYAGHDREFFDTVSRNANYLSLAYERATPGCGRTAVRVALKAYLGGEEAGVTWGPERDRGRRFADYDRLTLRGTCRVGRHTFDVEWRVGDLGLGGDSITLGWQWDIAEIPLYLRVHSGPMNTLSNYTQRQDSIGIGIRLARFR